ncbi:tyrosine aminotransferase [Schistocerca americana]|uniref:tyrosine aminotransferase n=1 Tax=Schistocerca americana TaxID=7009 RepID=UPI001F4F24CC|nr:tyrosine aminotransferase [Schistocerca americana]
MEPQQPQQQQQPQRGDWARVPASCVARRTHNPLRTIVEELAIQPNPDKHFIALSIGDPTTFGNLRPAPEVVKALHDSIDSGSYHGYGPSVGHLEAREAVARYSSTEKVHVEAKDVVLCSGCSSALDLSITALASPGQNILMPRPAFPLYRTLAESIGVETRSYNLLPENDWEADLNHLESQIDENTAAIVVCNPSNPCGSVFKKQHLKDMLSIAARHKLPIIADEIYEHMVFPGHEFHHLASLSEEVPILSCSGLTKRFLVPGWRMGWIIIHDRNGLFDKEIRKALLSLSQRTIGSNTLVQGAIPAILSNTPQKFFEDTIKVLQDNADLAYDILSEVKGLRPVMPQGAMYMMVGITVTLFPEFSSDLDFVERLVSEESVFCLPSQCFNYPNYMRLVLTVPKEQMEKACKRIAAFCQRHHQDYLSKRISSVSIT